MNFCITCSDALFWWIFGDTNWKSMFLSWILWMKMLEDSLLSFLKRGFKIMVARISYNFHIHWKLIVLSDFSCILLGWNYSCSHTSPWCIYSLWNIWTVICLSGLNLSFLSIQWHQPLFLFFIINDCYFSSERVFCFVYFCSSSVSYYWIVI